MLTLVMGSVIGDRFTERRQLLVTSQAAMIPCCLLSAIIYTASGGLDTSNFTVFAIPAILGGAIGSILLDKIKPIWIGRIFSALVIWSGLRMIVR